MLLLELESRPASAIKLPPGQAMCTCAQSSPRDLWLEAETGTAGRERFPRAVRSRRAPLPGILCSESSSYVLGALSSQLGSLHVIEQEDSLQS